MDNIVVEKRDHSKFGASGSYIWLNCFGAHGLRNKLLTSTSANNGGIAANEGTAAHELAAKCLDEGLDIRTFKGIIIDSGGYTFTVTQDMIDYLSEYIDFVRKKVAQYPGAILRVEKSIYSILDEDAWGTSDATIYVPDDRIIIVDLKYGRGEVVEPHSSQLKEYGWLSYECKPDEMGEPKVIELWIAQPRIPHPKGTLRRFVTNVEELQSWFLDTALPAMAEGRKPDAPLVIGSWCKWCPARNQCPALNNEVKTVNVSNDPIQMSNEEIGEMLRKLSAIKGYETALEAEAFKRAMAGGKIPGKKLVNKKANRIWKDGAETMAAMTFDTTSLYTTPEFKGPPAVEKLPGGKDFTARYAFTPVTGLTLADEGDKRLETKPLMVKYLEAMDKPPVDTPSC